MKAQTEPETFAAYVTRCMMCDAEVSYLSRDENGKSIIHPCGHPANIRLAPNPRLRPRPA